MSEQVVEINCPGCGARVAISQKVCEWCYQPIIISTFNSVYSMSMPQVKKYTDSYQNALSKNPNNTVLNNSIAMCYLKLKLYDKALPAFEKAIENNFNNSETFFYAAVCLLRGKKAFLIKRADIDRINEYIQAALMIEPKGIYYYFLAYIKYDHFFRKRYKTSPNYQEVLVMAQQVGLSDSDIDQFYTILGVERPNCL